MPIRTLRILSALLAAVGLTVGLGWAKHPAPPAPPAPSSAPIDFSALAESLKSQTKEIQLRAQDLPTLPSRLEYQHPMAVLLPDKVNIIQQLLSCSGKRCTPRVIRAIDKSGVIDAQARLELPALPSGASGFEFEPLGLLDVDHDGKDELLVRYTINGPERQGAGPKWTDMLAIINLPEMTLAFLHELKRGGRDGIDNFCEFQVTQCDLNADGRLDLRLVQTCRCAEKKGCSSMPAFPMDFRATPDRRFVLGPTSHSPAVTPPAK